MSSSTLSFIILACFLLVTSFEPTILFLMAFLLADGRIDYNEFVAMMRKGNGGIGRRTMRNSLNVSMKDAVTVG